VICHVEYIKALQNALESIVDSMKQTDQDIPQAFSRLRTVFFEKKRSEYENKNIFHDLSVMKNRIQTGQYAETDFIQRNRFDTGRRTEEFLRYMEGYIHQSEQWATILKPILRRGDVQTITDICPGWAPKIELALIKLGYTGNITVFDKSHHPIKHLLSMISLFKPLYTISEKTGNVLSTTKKPQSDLTVCNHIVDDLLFSVYADATGIPLNQLYLDENMYIQATEKISHSRKITASFPELFVQRINQFIPLHGIFVMMHYPGMTESSLQLKPWIIFCNSLIQNIYMEFLSAGYTHIQKQKFHKKTPEVFILQKNKH
jgi:hypothetical protein